MSVTSKSPKAVLLSAFAMAQGALRPYAHRYSPKKFTQHQLFACLVLKCSLKLDYRGVVELLRDAPSLAESIELKKIPHFTTLQKAAKRLLVITPFRRLLRKSIRMHLRRRRKVDCSAMDSTGFESTSASGYFVRRRARSESPWKTVVYHRFPKLGIVSGTRDHFIYACRASRGPRPDVDEFRPLLAEAVLNVGIESMACDAGYDSEGNHCYAREQHGIRTMIPAKHGRPTSKPATGHYRRLMQVRFSKELYVERVQIETTNSMIKRRQGSYVHGRKYQSQCRDLRLMALTHNAMILVYLQVFYRASQA